MILVLEDRYGFSLSIDAKKKKYLSFDVTMMFKWSQNHKKQILQIFAENMLIFKMLPKILGICNFNFFFFANCKRKWQ